MITDCTTGPSPPKLNSSIHSLKKKFRLTTVVVETGVGGRAAPLNRLTMMALFFRSCTKEKEKKRTTTDYMWPHIYLRYFLVNFKSQFIFYKILFLSIYRIKLHTHAHYTISLSLSLSSLSSLSLSLSFLTTHHHSLVILQNQICLTF